MSTEALPRFSENSNSDYYPEPADDVIDFKDYARTIRKHRWLIFLTTALVTALAAYVVSGMTPIYRSTSTLLIETQQTMPINFDVLSNIDTTNGEYYQTQFEVLKSRKLARRVIQEMGLFKHPELHRDSDSQSVAIIASGNEFGSDSTFSTGEEGISDTEVKEQQLAVDRFLRNLTIAPVKNTKLVRITYQSRDPLLASQVANKIADTYIVNYLDSRLEMGEKATEWLGERLTQHKLKLEESQEKLLVYREENGLIDLNRGIGQLTEQEIGIVTSKLIEAEARMAHATILYDDVRTTGQNPESLLGLPIIASNEMVQRFKIELQQTDLNLSELNNRYGEKHPKVIDALSRKTTAKSNLDSQIYNIVDTIKKQFTLAQQTVASLQSSLDKGKREIQQVGRSQIELMNLEREVELNQKMYDTFYTRMREVDEAENLSTTNAQISEFAEAAINPFKPKKTLIVILSFIASLFAAIAAAILFESLNRKIASTEDIENGLNLRMLGIIPLVTKKVLRKSGLSIPRPGHKLEDRGHFAESIRTIRTSVSLHELESPNKVILITSALPGEGKSTMAGHLAHSFAQMEKVLLLECDLRKPSQHHTFDIETEYGLTELLTGEAKFRQCIQINAAENLDIIPAGAIPEHPLELLSGENFKHLVAQLKKRYDRIIIDCAPVQAVSDALILGQLTDAVIYTVKANSTELEVTARGVKRLRDSGINLIGAVVTQVNISKVSGYNGDLGYQGYYDYYGYSDTESTSKTEQVIQKKPAKKVKTKLESTEEAA